MSLAIDVGKVEMVLLADDGWHEVADSSFNLDAYKYMEKKRAVLKGGQVPGVPSTGATWKERSGAIVACPITAILAVKWNIGVHTMPPR